MGKGRSRAHAAAARDLVIDGLPVRLVRKRVKNINLRVRQPDGCVEVSAPSFIPESEIVGFIREKRVWIEKKRAQTATSPAAVAAQATPEQIAEWREVVQACVPPLIAAWEPILGVKARTLVYRNMKSRWGSCQPATGRICINVRLALYPPECLEYVVVHELCHLLERGHGLRFKALMDAFMPDWRERRAKLH